MIKTEKRVSAVFAKVAPWRMIFINLGIPDISFQWVHIINAEQDGVAETRGKALEGANVKFDIHDSGPGLNFKLNWKHSFNFK